jgi:hypothetical protein
MAIGYDAAADFAALLPGWRLLVRQTGLRHFLGRRTGTLFGHQCGGLRTGGCFLVRRRNR